MRKLIIPECIRSIAVVGMQKNTGKTETLNWLLRLHYESGTVVGLTSIGVDGEMTDQVTNTVKPEIEVGSGTLIATSEQHFRSKRFPAEILALSTGRTALGRLVTARAKAGGKILVSGPSYSLWLKKCIRELHGFGAERVLVDGALFRLSPASPAVTDALILATGAALSLNYAELVKKTVHTINMMQLPADEQAGWGTSQDGIWCADRSGAVTKLQSESALAVNHGDLDMLSGCRTVYVNGSVSDGFLSLLMNNRCAPEIVVHDFTRLFTSPEKTARYFSAGGSIRVRNAARLLAITVNPWSPSGYLLDEQRIIDGIASRTAIPVINIRKQ